MMWLSRLLAEYKQPKSSHPLWQESCVNNVLEHAVDLPVVNCLLCLIAWSGAAHVEVGTGSVSGEWEGNCAARWMLRSWRGRNMYSPAVLTALALFLFSPQDLGACVLPRSSRFEALGLSSCYIAVGFLKNSPVLGSFCRITTDVAKRGLTPKMCSSEFRLPLLSNVSFTFIILQQTHSSLP